MSVGSSDTRCHLGGVSVTEIKQGGIRVRNSALGGVKRERVNKRVWERTARKKRNSQIE